jgi:hypothetical protein
VCHYCGRARSGVSTRLHDVYDAYVHTQGRGYHPTSTRGLYMLHMYHARAHNGLNRSDMLTHTHTHTHTHTLRLFSCNSKHKSSVAVAVHGHALRALFLPLTCSKSWTDRSITLDTCHCWSDELFRRCGRVLWWGGIRESLRGCGGY